MDESTSKSGAARLGSPSGLEVEFNGNGSMRRFTWGTISLGLFVGSEIEGGPTNLYLRRLGNQIEWTPLLGPAGGTVSYVDGGQGRLVGSGSWNGIDYTITFLLARSAPAWFWHVRLENATDSAQQLDLTYAQDLALAPYGAVRMNEFYVSQYIDHTPLHHGSRGIMLASRQNQGVDGRHPWSLIGSLRGGTSFATDALQFLGVAGRTRAAPPGLCGNLPGRRLQHEHSMVVIRETPLRLAPGEAIDGGFFGTLVADHRQATSVADLVHVDEALALPEAAPVGIEPPAARILPASTLFTHAPILNCADLETEALRALFGTGWRHEEFDEHGGRLSFFHGVGRHVVLRAKEVRVQRPHGQILRTGRHLTPAECSLTSTVWMSGVFHSMVTQGHVSINRFLSTVRAYLGLFRAQGQRVFAELGGIWHLLETPSAFEMADTECRWIYVHEAGVIQVRSEARDDPHELRLKIEVSAGPPVRFLIAHHVALNGDDGVVIGGAQWRREAADIVLSPAPGSELAHRFADGSFRIAPLPGSEFERVGGDELLYSDGRSREQPYLCIMTAAVRSAGLAIRGQLIDKETQSPQLAVDVAALTPTPRLTTPRTGAIFDQAARLMEIAPWFAQNAFVHYLAPRGLEQFSGGGWGTRDVCQGPVEMLLALGQHAPIRDLLLRVMAMQEPDGDWPQWFMFFERERDIRAGDSHGDIVLWPLVVLAQYLDTTGDASVLNECVGFFDSRGVAAGERASVWEHVQRALALIERRTFPNTCLAAYGNGDWNDSLQPADPRMRDHMCSSWTVTLQYKVLRELAHALRSIGRAADAPRLELLAQSVQRDFRDLLLVDRVLAGYALSDADGQLRHLLHPRDRMTGVRYSSLAMIQAILENLFTPEQAREHMLLIEAELCAPDGLRLFDRPFAYEGGPQRLFQRAETATFFGREIGLMYMHAHLRYAQALAHLGEASRFFHALCLANPIGIGSLVPSATLRQSNCYYSSSDAAFADRYQALAEYDRVRRGTIAFDGGWRVYSSGAGIALGLITRRFLGISVERGGISIDPVMPGSLDGLTVEMQVLGRDFEICYRVGSAGCGVNSAQLNDAPLAFTNAPNPYRRGAAVVTAAALQAHLKARRNVLAIEVG
jgi:1,2-beta-oligoglucan phosphorylase